MRQHEPGVTGPLADAAVDDGLVVGLDEPVELFELVTGAEAAVGVGGFAPRDRARRRDVTRPQRPLLGVVGHVGALAGVLLGGADVDQRLAAQRGQHVVFERADRCVVARDDGIAGRGFRRYVQGGLAPLGEPQVASPVEQPNVRMAEQGEHPQRIRRPPVALVAVDHHGVVAGDALAVHQLGELLAGDVVAHPRVVEVGVPVDLDRAGNMADVVEQHVLVGFHDGQTGSAHVGGQPVGGDQPFGVGVAGQSGTGICW